MKKHLPDYNLFLGRSIPGLKEIKIIKHIDSGLNGHVFKAHNATLNKDYACKLIPVENIAGFKEGDNSWADEAKFANELESEHVVKCYASSYWFDENLKINCVVLCFDYVNGPSLKKYISNHKNNISVGFIEKFLLAIFSLLFELSKRGDGVESLSHGDLYEGNVLVYEGSPYQVHTKPSFKITDFGVGRVTATMKLRDDYEGVADILRILLSNVNYQSAIARDKFVFNELNNSFLARYLIETDITREPLARNPGRLYEAVEELDVQFSIKQRSLEEFKLTSPFDYLSCEQIGEAHSILQSLYSDRFLGLQGVEARNNLVLTGPRGCGKSTVFKSLSLKHRTLVNNANPDDVTYIGIYYRCDDLYFIFPRYTRPERKEAVDLPIHYLTATLLIELFKSIEMWSRECFKDEYLYRQERLCVKVWEVLELKKPNSPDVNTFNGINRKLEKERHRVKDKQKFADVNGVGFGKYFGPEILPRVCKLIVHHLPYLSDKPIFFFVDDYSAPRITESLQESLNRLVMQRASDCFFKLSTESPVSYYPKDIDGKTYVEGREINLLDLALTYFSAKQELKLAFIEDVIERRLNSVRDYPATTLYELIGDSESINDNEHALRMRQKRKQTFHGRDTLVNLCSGDIHYIINLLGRMVDVSGGASELNSSKGVALISEKNQNNVIRSEAGNFLTTLMGLCNYGAKLVKIVTAFGKVAHSYLLYKDSGNNDASPPHLASRIEPNESLVLSAESEELYQELLRYSVFIREPRGKSIRGNVVPRLWLRRFLIPHFNLTFSKRDSIRIDNVDVELLLSDPDEFSRRKTLKKMVSTENDKQLSMNLNNEKNDE